jgi:ParB/RepB/Spo0J family partition protein
MAGSKRMRDALLATSVDAMTSGRGATANVAQSAASTWIPVAEIAPDPDQPRSRMEPEALDRLVASIRALGQIEPIVVEPLALSRRDTTMPFRYRCLSGHRRLRAHELLGLDEIRALVVREPLQPAERLMREVAANEVREDHSDYDRARYMVSVLGTILETGSAPDVAAVKRFVNRVFNALDRGKPLEPEVDARVRAFEERLVALGERRNLRWLHRWGLAVLALEGAALEAALGGLDARRALMLASLSPRDAELDDADRLRRETLIGKAAALVREASLPHRDVRKLVAELARTIGTDGSGENAQDTVLERWRGSGTELEDNAPEHAPRSSPKRGAVAAPSEAASNAAESSKSLHDRALALSARWSFRDPSTGAGDAIGERDLVDWIDRVATRTPRRAERVIKALERANSEIDAIEARRARPARATRP